MNRTTHTQRVAMAVAGDQTGARDGGVTVLNSTSGPITTGSRRLSPRQALSVHRERLVWGRRTTSWEEEGSQGLTRVVEAVLDRCRTPAGTVAVDLGCGSGQVTLPLAPRCERVLAVDVNAPAIEMLESKAREQGVGNIQATAESMQALQLDPGSLHLVVTNYALHHLATRTSARFWCTPTRGCGPAVSSSSAT